MSINVQDCEFISSAVKSSQYPVHDYPEIALVGRSNVGKSSLINALVNRKKLARVSGQDPNFELVPGRSLSFSRSTRLRIRQSSRIGKSAVEADDRRLFNPAPKFSGGFDGG